MFISRPRGFSVLALALSLMAGCTSINQASTRLASVITPYKIDIVQGNFVSREQLQALKDGMSQQNVRDILGTPLLASIFHADRWDYVFTFKRQGAQPQSRRVTLFFKDKLLSRIEADELPSETEFVASLNSTRQASRVPVLEMSAAELTALTPKPLKPVAQNPLPVLPSSYPPLEPIAQ